MVVTKWCTSIMVKGNIKVEKRGASPESAQIGLGPRASGHTHALNHPPALALSSVDISLSDDLAT
jgi:hypothetical protein